MKEEGKGNTGKRRNEILQFPSIFLPFSLSFVFVSVSFSWFCVLIPKRSRALRRETAPLFLF